MAIHPAAPRVAAPAPNPGARWATARRSGRTPGIAALLGILLPGLGQLWAGRPVRALVVALPAVAVAVGGWRALDLAGGPLRLALGGLDPAVLLALLWADVALLAYHAWAVADGFDVARRARGGASRGAAVALVLALVTTIGAHGLVAAVGWYGYDLVTSVFARGGGAGPVWNDGLPVAEPGPTATARSPAPSPSATRAATPDATSAPTATPVPYWAADGRLDLLLVGGDAGPDRFSIRTDTLILLSVDLASARAALVGIPRNLRWVPLPEPYAHHVRGGVFPDLLNALWRYADGRPRSFPGNDETRGFRAVSAAVGHLLGVEVDGLVYLDLAGFVRVVDALGGLEIDVPAAVHDRAYPDEDGSGWRVLDIRPGLQRLSGRDALAYARTRRQDSDYGRMQRQQLVLLALRRQVNPCTVLPRIPELVEIAKGSLWTNIPLEELPALASLAARTDPARIERLALTPANGYPQWVTARSAAAMRAAVRGLFAGEPPPADAGPGIPIPGC